MKLLFIITELNPGGAEHALTNIACNLADDGATILMITLYGNKTPLTQKLQSHQIQTHSLNIDSIFDICRIHRLRHIVQKFQPDIINSWLIHANLLSRLFLPNTYYLVNSLRVEDKRKHINLLEKLTKHIPNHFICVSKNVQNYAENILNINKTKCCVIENGIDTALFKKITFKKFQANQISGLTIARICHQKGIDILIKSLNDLPPNINWHWTIIGAIEEYQYYKNVLTLIDNLSLKDKITFIQPVSQNNLPHFFSQSNIFILPSRWEGNPNIIREALSVGLPAFCWADQDLTDEQIQTNIKNTIINKPTATNIKPITWQDCAKQYQKIFQYLKNRHT